MSRKFELNEDQEEYNIIYKSCFGYLGDVRRKVGEMLRRNRGNILVTCL
jgi:hypothetical protein